ncbi:MAG: hypothetical protein MJ250_03590 [Alphaproteobacteria bacterium]|nr:hypothetical protein [Alphaproteobacteria bacterium]
MLIINKYINNVEKYTGSYKKNNKSIIYVRSLDNVSIDLLQKIGFSSLPQNGECIVPANIGRFTSFNLYGKFLIRKGLPKENRFVNTVLWKWKLWNGECREKYCDIYKKCYPKEFVNPPLEKVFFYEKNNCVISRPVNINEENCLLHLINMFLEIFGNCFITEDIDNIIPVEKVPWIIFPQGEKMVSAQNLFPNYNKLRDTRKKFIDDRIKLLNSFSPRKIYRGESYFRNYVAFEFENLIVLECDNIDNATYVFDKNWEDYSKLTKKEVLTNNYQKTRIIHNSKWFELIVRVLNK